MAAGGDLEIRGMDIGPLDMGGMDTRGDGRTKGTWTRLGRCVDTGGLDSWVLDMGPGDLDVGKDVDSRDLGTGEGTWMQPFKERRGQASGSPG